MCVDCQVDPLIDCSDEAQAERAQQLRDIRAMLFSVVTNVSDRGRSVSYDRRELPNLEARLLGEMYYCRYGYLPTQSGIRFIPGPGIIKGL